MLAIIKRYACVENFCQLDMLLQRNNLMMINEMFCHVTQQMLRGLLGLNRIYYFGFKWLDVIASMMTLAPPNFAERLRRIWTTDPLEGGRELATLVEDTYQLLEIHCSEVDVETLRRIFREPRPSLEDRSVNLRELFTSSAL